MIEAGGSSCIIAGMGLQRFPLGGFLGGMNLVDNPYSLRSGEAQLALDVDIGVRDVLGNRRGFASTLVGAINSQTKSPGTVENFGVSGTSWTNPENAKASDNTRATISAAANWQSKTMRSKSYGFALPAGAIPIGVSTKVERSAGFGSAKVTDRSFQLVKASANAGTPKGSVTEYPQINDEVVEKGSSSDLWGTTLTKAEVENAGFGFDYAAQTLGAPPGEVLEARVDQVQMTVWFVEPGVSPGLVDHLRSWYTGVKRRLLMSQNGNIKALDAGAVSTLFAGTAATTWCFEQMEKNPGAGYKDYLWSMNGVDAAKKWDGTTFSDWAGKPPKGNMLRVWKNRMIVSGHPNFPQRVFYSEIANPELPEDETNGGYGNNWIDVRTSEDDLDPVTWLEVIDDVLIVFKKKSVNAVYDPSTFSFTRIANVGCEGRFQSCVLDDRCYFVNRAGVFSVTAQGAPRYESLNIEPLFKGTGPEGLEAIDLNLLATSARMCSLPNGVVHLACTPKASLANRWVLKAYPRLRGQVGDRNDPRTPWVKDSFTKRCVKSMCSYRTKDEEVDKVVSGLTDEAGASPELAYLYQGYKDGAEPISWQWRSGFKSLISEEPLERIRRVNLTMTGKLKAKTIADGKQTAEAVLESEKEELEYFRPESRGRYHALDLSESGQVPTQVFKGELVLRGGKEER